MTETPKERFDRATERFDRQRKLGPLALLRLRAEVLLERHRNGEIALIDAERSELDRIAVAATEDDRGFLGSFDAEEGDDEEMTEQPIGYWAIMIPKLAFWQGFYLLPVGQEHTDKPLQDMREVAATRMPPPIEPIAGVAPEDQAVVGMACAVLVEYGRIGNRPGVQGQMAVTSKILSDLIGHKFFYIIGDIQERGTLTTIIRMPVDYIEQARTHLRGLPLVAEIERNFAEGKTRH